MTGAGRLVPIPDAGPLPFPENFMDHKSEV
jgi:hypothetical protein